MTTIHDVAQAAGVSTATVSRALRGLPRVHDETRARVLSVAAELNYVASPTASGLASGRTDVVGVVVPFVTRWYFANLIHGVERSLHKQGYHVLLYDVGGVGANRSLVLDHRLLWKRVDAVLVLSIALEPAEVATLEALRLPVVTIGVEAASWDCVRVDDRATAVTATEHLLGLGHRRIAYVGGNPARDVHVSTPKDRQSGYEQALAAAGIDVDPALMVASDWTVRGGIAAMETLLERSSGAGPPTAIFAASDEMAIGALHVARREGLDVPGDLSIIGIDDHEMSFTHDLTTVRQPVQEQGRLAGGLLLEALAAHDGTSPPRGRRIVTTATSLVVRGSTAAPPPGGQCAGADPTGGRSEPRPASSSDQTSGSR